jgi:hypothetical protein
LKKLDLKKNPAKLETLNSALVKAPKDVIERVILGGSRNDRRVAKVFWDAPVTAEGRRKGKNSKAKILASRDMISRRTKNELDDSCLWHYGQCQDDRIQNWHY